VAINPIYTHFDCLTASALVHMSKSGKMTKADNLGSVEWDYALAAAKKACDEWNPEPAPAVKGNETLTTSLSTRHYQYVLIH